MPVSYSSCYFDKMLNRCKLREEKYNLVHHLGTSDGIGSIPRSSLMKTFPIQAITYKSSTFML